MRARKKKKLQLSPSPLELSQGLSSTQPVDGAILYKDPSWVPVSLPALWSPNDNEKHCVVKIEQRWGTFRPFFAPSFFLRVYSLSWISQVAELFTVWVRTGLKKLWLQCIVLGLDNWFLYVFLIAHLCFSPKSVTIQKLSCSLPSCCDSTCLLVICAGLNYHSGWQRSTLQEADKAVSLHSGDGRGSCG